MSMNSLKISKLIAFARIIFVVVLLSACSTPAVVSIGQAIENNNPLTLIASSEITIKERVSIPAPDFLTRAQHSPVSRVHLRIAACARNPEGSR